jgi:tetratricopeptide (TPR) repeat protein
VFPRTAIPALLVLLAACGEARAQSETILILPFFNLSKSKNLDWIGDSISETLLDALGSEGMDVVGNEARETALNEAGVRRYSVLTQASVAELAAMVSAGVAVSGDFDVYPGAGGESVARLRARTLEVRRVRKGSEFEVSGPLVQLSSLQTSLAWQVLQALSAGGASSEESFLRTHPPIRLDALESYVRGVLIDAPDQRLKLLAAATRLEPTFGLAQFQLGLTLFHRRDYKSAAAALARVPGESLRGREALFFLGLARYHQGDFPGAVQSWQSLANKVPMAEVFNNLGAAQLRAGAPGAAETFEKAVETDPSDPDYQFNLGYAYWREGQFDKAAARFRLSLERHTEDELATLLLGRSLQKAGPRPGDLRTEAAERLKTTYSDAAFLALKSMLREKP